mgnify:CR=1 FL=1
MNLPRCHHHCDIRLYSTAILSAVYFPEVLFHTPHKVYKIPLLKQNNFLPDLDNIPEEIVSVLGNNTRDIVNTCILDIIKKEKNIK